MRSREKNAKTFFLSPHFILRFMRYLHINYPVGIYICSLALCILVLFFFHCSIDALRRFVFLPSENRSLRRTTREGKKSFVANEFITIKCQLNGYRSAHVLVINEMTYSSHGLRLNSNSCSWLKVQTIKILHAGAYDDKKLCVILILFFAASSPAELRKS